jgi:SAM-dependent methyltransferase
MTSAPLYDAFASHYDTVVGLRPDVARYLHRLIRRYAPDARSVLELGCGSGSMLSLLAKRYDATGIDSSRSMLSIARKKAPRARLLEGDITSFSLQERFDVILCPFDTINHVTSFSLWKRVFANACAHLNPNGIFIFDVNTEHKMESYRLDPVTAEVTQRYVSIVEVSRSKRYHYTVHLKLFKRQGRDTFKLYSMNLPEIVVPNERIVRALSRHFSSVTLVDPDRRRPTSQTEELYFICQRPRVGFKGQVS